MSFDYAAGSAIRNRGVQTPKEDVEALLWTMLFCLDACLPWTLEFVDIAMLLNMKMKYPDAGPSTDCSPRDKLRTGILHAITDCRSNPLCYERVASLLTL